MFQNLPLTAAQEVHDSSSGVTLCIVMKNVGVLYHQVPSFSPEFMRLRSLRQLKEPLQWTRYSVRDELIRAIALSIRTIDKDGRADGVHRLQTFAKR